MVLRVISDQGLYEVDTELPPSKWLAQVGRMEVEDVVFLSFDEVQDWRRDGSSICKPVVVRVESIESVRATS